MFASNCSSFCSAFSDLRHDSDWYSNNLLPLDSNARKVEDSGRLFSSLEVQNVDNSGRKVEDPGRTFSSLEVQNVFGHSPVLDVLGNDNGGCWQTVDYSSYVANVGHGSDTFYGREMSEENMAVRTESYREPLSCCLTSPVLPTLPVTTSGHPVPPPAPTSPSVVPNAVSSPTTLSCSPAVPSPTVHSCAPAVLPTVAPATVTNTTNSSPKQSSRSPSSLEEIKVEIDPALSEKEASPGTKKDCADKDSCVEKAAMPECVVARCAEDAEAGTSEDEEAGTSGSSDEDVDTDVDARLARVFSFVCDRCPEQSFAAYEQLDVHCRSQHRANGLVKCCGLVLSDRDELVAHLERHPPSYRCKECGKELASRSVREAHARQHHSSGQQFECSHCNKRFSSKYGLANHENLHLPEGERPFKCRHCGKGFGAKHAATKHERTHLPDEERLSFVCDVCGKRFGYASTLDGHQRHVHQKERPFVCHVCAKTFPIKGALTYHLTTHEQQARVQCGQCGIWLKNEKILRIHRKCHQGELFSCPHCDKVSSTRNSLRMHMKRHSDTRPHACPLCVRAFKTPRDLKTHMVQHTGQKPYSCPYCPKTFASPSNFYAHRKMKHKMGAAGLQF